MFPSEPKWWTDPWVTHQNPPLVNLQKEIICWLLTTMSHVHIQLRALFPLTFSNLPNMSCLNLKYPQKNFKNQPISIYEKSCSHQLNHHISYLYEEYGGHDLRCGPDPVCVCVAAQSATVAVAAVLEPLRSRCIYSPVTMVLANYA